MNTVLETAIREIPSWETLTKDELFVELYKPTKHHQDLRVYDLIDIAKVIGDTNMNNFLEAVKATQYKWMVEHGLPKFVPGDEPINTRLKQIDNVYAKQLAEHTNRMVSLVEYYNLLPSLQEISEVRFKMLTDIEKQRLTDIAVDAHQLHLERIGSWNGNPDTKPKQPIYETES